MFSLRITSSITSRLALAIIWMTCLSCPPPIRTEPPVVCWGALEAPDNAVSVPAKADVDHVGRLAARGDERLVTGFVEWWVRLYNGVSEGDSRKRWCDITIRSPERQCVHCHVHQLWHELRPQRDFFFVSALFFYHRKRGSTEPHLQLSAFKNRMSWTNRIAMPGRWTLTTFLPNPNTDIMHGINGLLLESWIRNLSMNVYGIQTVLYFGFGAVTYRYCRPWIALLTSRYLPTKNRGRTFSLA